MARIPEESMAPPRRWKTEAARKAAYRDKRRGIELPDDHYNDHARDPQHQYTYAIAAVSGGEIQAIKLGIALDPEQRLRNLQTGSPVELRLLGTIPAGPAVEALLHTVFKAQLLRGEWYSPDIYDDVTTLLRILGSTKEA